MCRSLQSSKESELLLFLFATESAFPFLGVEACSAELGGTTPPADFAMANEKDRSSSVPPDEFRSRSFVRICVYQLIADPALSERFACSRQTRRLCGGSAAGSNSFVSTTSSRGEKRD